MMKSNLSGQRTILTLFTLLAFAWAGGAADVTESRKPEVRIAAASSTVLLGEPVVVTLTVRNVSAADIDVAVHQDIRTSLPYFTIKSSEGSAQRFVPVSQAMAGGRRKVTLPPGQALTGTHLLVFGRDGFAFPKSGEYELTAGYEELTSNTISLHVLDPAGENALALPLVMDQEKGLALVGASNAPAALESLEKLIASHPTTVYAPFAACALAQRALSYSQYDEATTRFEWLLANAPAFPLMADVRLSLAQAYHGKGNVEKASEQIAAVIASSPNTTTAREAQRLQQEWAKPSE